MRFRVSHRLCSGHTRTHADTHNTGSAAIQAPSLLTVRIAVLFFLPLIISTELHQLSHSLVHAFLARLGDATITLAAFSIAFAFNTTLSGFISVEVQAAMAYVTDKRSFWRIVRFYFAMALVPFVAIEM